MNFDRNTPQVTSLKLSVEKRFGRAPIVHADFLALAADIWQNQRQHISETTLERVWGYSTRGYDTVSLYTLNLLSQYACNLEWKDYCNSLAASPSESEMSNEMVIYTKDLRDGDKIHIGWLPDRECIIRYLGDGAKFEAEWCNNSKMQPGDTFECLQFSLFRELCMTNFVAQSCPAAQPCNYVVGSVNGLTILRLIRPNNE